MARGLEPLQDNTFLELGRFLSEESFSRERKEIEIGNIKLDLLKKGEKKIVVGEIKKSSRFLRAAEMQLLFYLYRLKERGIEAIGELLIPKEKKRLEVKLSPEKEKEVEEAITKVKEIISAEEPPSPKKCRFCTNCAYREFCWV